MAHVIDAIWQKTTESVHDNFSDTYFIQLHGFSKQSTDPYVIMSNGTRETPFPDKISELRDFLLIEDNTLTFKIGHLDLTWNRLLGFTNTNGRYINSSINPCNENADETNGRFLHIEQEKTKLRDDSIGWLKMANALSATFNANMCDSMSTSTEYWDNFSPQKNQSLTRVFFDGKKIRIEDFNFSKGAFLLFNQLGQLILEKEIQKGATDIFLTQKNSDIYFFQIKTPRKIESGKILIIF